MPLIELAPVDRRKPASNWLASHAANVTSQHGQDGVIAKIFEVIGTTSKACCEFGAWDGKRYSNTWSLIAEQGWEGYLIEGNAARTEQIIRNHDGNPRAHAINAWVGFEEDTNIDAILAREGAPADLDLMVIDIDGNDWHVWDSMRRTRPRVVAIEYNPTMGNDVVFVQDRDWQVHHGNSIAAAVRLGKEKGYELVSTQGDAFFVLAELFPSFGIADNSIDALHQCRIEAKVLTGYDGTLWVAGHRKLGWSQRGVSYGPGELQVLEAEKRGYRG